MSKIAKKLINFKNIKFADPVFLLGVKSRYFYDNSRAKLLTSIIDRHNLINTEKRSCLFRLNRAKKCLKVEDLFSILENNINENFIRDRYKEFYIRYGKHENFDNMKDILCAKYIQQQVLQIALLELENIPIILSDDYMFILYSRAYYSGKKSSVDDIVNNSLKRFNSSYSDEIISDICGVFGGMYGIMQDREVDNAVLSPAVYNINTGCFIENINKYLITRDIFVIVTNEYLIEIDLHSKKTMRKTLQNMRNMPFFKSGFYASPFNGTIHSLFFKPRKIDFTLSSFKGFMISGSDMLTYVRAEYKDVYGKEKLVFLSNNSMLDGVDITKFEKYKMLVGSRINKLYVNSYDIYHIVKYLGHYIVVYDEWKIIEELHVIKETSDKLFIYSEGYGITIFSKTKKCTIGTITLSRDLYEEFFTKSMMRKLKKVENKKTIPNLITYEKFYTGGFKCSLFNLNTRLKCLQQEKTKEASLKTSSEKEKQTQDLANS